MEQPLPQIPVFDVGADFPMQVGLRVGNDGYRLLEDALGSTPKPVVRLLDRISRAWLVRHRSPYLGEIDRLALRARAPGLHFLNVSYEWGCTTAAKPSPEDKGRPVLLRTLDWHVDGIGRSIVAARIANPLGRWVTLTWPAYTGVLHGLARGRFAAAMNQPTHRRITGSARIDWMIAKARVWGSPHLQPAHLLRRVFETAPDFATARRLLIETPVAAPAIYTLAGIRAGEAVTIERREASARIIADAHAANEWRSDDWRGGHHTALLNDARLGAMLGQATTWDVGMGWVSPPILTGETRLALVASPATGRLIARGFEAGKPATATLDLVT